MANPIFPSLLSGYDSLHYRIAFEDPAMKTELEGGYVASRPRHTRAPRRTWTFGYTRMSDADYQALVAFYNQVHGGSLIFDWTNLETEAVHQVRFATALDLKYEGFGPTKLWSGTVQVQEA